MVLRALLLAIVFAFGLLVWMVVVAPPVLSFAMAAALAVTFCIWGEQHPHEG